MQVVTRVTGGEKQGETPMAGRLVSRQQAYAVWAVLVTMVVVLDQISKDLARKWLADSARAFIPGFLEFRLTLNSGAAWGLFVGRRTFFLIMALLTLAAVIYYLISQNRHSVLTVVSLGFFTGGSLGNAIDRFISGQVVDFLNFQFIEFPIFNLADSAICLGVALLMLAILFSYRSPKNPEPQDA